MAYRHANFPVVRDSQGIATDSTSGTVKADTSTIPAGVYEVLVICAQTALAVYTLQVRNAANSATVGDAHSFYGHANGTVALPFRVELEPNQRIRVVMGANLTGDSGVSIIAQRVA
jgi:hypothetical protein